MRIKTKFRLHNGHQAVMSLAKIDGLDGDDNLQAFPRKYHARRSTRTISPRRDTLISPGTRITIPSVSMLIDPMSP